jgi:Hint domain
MLSQNGSIVSVIVNGTTLGELTFANTAQAALAESTPGALDDRVICFCAGTQIATPTGEVPVERLAAGDEVLTQRGAASLSLTSTGAGTSGLPNTPLSTETITLDGKVYALCPGCRTPQHDRP